MMKTEFASANALALSALGFISSIMGGIISDRYSGKNPMALAWVCIIGNLLSIPFCLGMFLLTNNFWLSIGCLSMNYLLANAWLAPAITMM
jgi:nitrate/nitrite transporter NarK